ncbi:partial DNA-binding protein, partial [Gammaproteobacteria bacterium]
MTQPPSNDPLHGITLEKLLTQLVDEIGWLKMGQQVRISCFIKEPSI